MSDEKPTGDAGASISERIEQKLAAREQPQQPQGEPGQSAPEEAQQDEQQAVETTAPEVEVPAGDDEGESEGPQFALSDVAKVLGVDESFLGVAEDGSLLVRTKVDGQEGTAKFQDLVRSYQLQGHIDQKARQTAEVEKQVAERVGMFEQFATTESQRLTALVQATEQMLMQDFANVNWDDLVHSDPIGYTEKRHQFEARSGQLQQLKGAIAQQMQTFTQAKAWDDQRQLASEAQRLLSMVPAWRDESVRTREQEAIAQWLYQNGADPSTIFSLRDAGVIAAIRAGMIAQMGAPKVAAAEKKVRAAPKLARPGQFIDQRQRATESVKGLKDQIRKSGGKQGIAEYLMATGKV